MIFFNTPLTGLIHYIGLIMLKSLLALHITILFISFLNKHNMRVDKIILLSCGWFLETIYKGSEMQLKIKF